MSAIVPIGKIMENPNGYKRIKTEDGWRFYHHVLAEKKYGRSLKAGERVKFVDNNRKNLKPENLLIVKTNQGSPAKRLAQLQARKAEIEGQIHDLLEAHPSLALKELRGS